MAENTGHLPTVTIEAVELLFGVEVATAVGQMSCTESKNAEDKKAKLLKSNILSGQQTKMIKLANAAINALLIPPA